MEGEDEEEEHKPQIDNGVPIVGFLAASMRMQEENQKTEDHESSDTSSIHEVLSHQSTGRKASLNSTEDFTQLSNSEKIRIAFELPAIESYYAEFSCWLVRSVLLKGCIYLTEGSLCFWSNISDRHQGISKKGFLKRRTGARRLYYSYWFVLDKNCLSCYQGPKELYYPEFSLSLDDQSASVYATDKPEHGFVLETSRKSYFFQADNEMVAKEWIKTLRTAIFRAVNEGEDIKIVLPFKKISNVDLVTNSPVKTILVEVHDADLGINEEYYFAYFKDIFKSYEVIKKLNEQDQLNSGLSGKRTSKMYDSTQISQLPPRPTESGSMSPSTDVQMSLESLLLGSKSRESSQRKKGHRKTNSESIIGERRPSIEVEPSIVTPPIPSATPPFSASTPTSPIMSPTSEKRPGWGYFSRSRKPVEYEDYYSLENNAKNQREFLSIFNVPAGEVLLGSYTCYLFRVLLRLGKIYISNNYVCFNSKLIGIRTKAVVPISDIRSIKKYKNTTMIYNTLLIITRDGIEIYFEFHSGEVCRRCYDLIQKRLDENSTATEEFYVDLPLKEAEENDVDFDIAVSKIESPSPMNVVCLTIGTRGDVQPFIALCKELLKDGHVCYIATHLEYQTWIESYGIGFREVKGDPAELMRLCVDNGGFSVNFFTQALGQLRGWFSELLQSCWASCQECDLIIASPTAFAGLHIAEALEIPLIFAFPMPWTRTTSFAHPFAVPEYKMGANYNYMTHVLIEEVLWKGGSPQVNDFRVKDLGLPACQFANVLETHIPFLYSFSPAVVPKPKDWPDPIHITGYWFLDDPEQAWEPSESLSEFLASKDDRPIIFIGFGSIIVRDPAAMTKSIVEAVQKAGVKAILSKGWSARSTEDSSNTETEPTSEEYPESIFPIDKVPHDWLFPQVDVVVHHGGAGTTAAGIRAGKPTIIKPWFGDQYFWKSIVEEMGIGVGIKNLTTKNLATAISAVVGDERMRERAKSLGDKVCQENGVKTAVNYIYRDLDFAKARILDLKAKNANKMEGGAESKASLLSLSGLFK